MEEGGEEVEEELGELTEEERAEYETLNRQLDQLDKVLDTLNTGERNSVADLQFRIPHGAVPFV